MATKVGVNGDAVQSTAKSVAAGSQAIADLLSKVSVVGNAAEPASATYHSQLTLAVSDVHHMLADVQQKLSTLEQNLGSAAAVLHGADDDVKTELTALLALLGDNGTGSAATSSSATGEAVRKAAGSLG